MAVNLRGVFLGCERAVAEMLGQEPVGEVRGRVVVIARRRRRRCASSPRTTPAT
jgi:hypothetical protein